MVERRLLVMRHAKSSWDHPAVGDHSRPLNERGRRDAPRIAERLRELGWGPDLVISSDSQRTKETWELMAPWFPSAQVRFTEQLYLADIDEVVAELLGVSADVRTVMVLGHNPGWEDAVHELTGIHVRMTTANVALLRTEAATWADAAARTGWQLAPVLRPKEL